MLSIKRAQSPSSEDILAPKKRLKTYGDPAIQDEMSLNDQELQTELALAASLENPHYYARQGIQKSVASVLKCDGFDTATPEALESFTSLVEAYIVSILGEIKSLSLASRREQPIPSDFDCVFRRYNLPLSSLLPYLDVPSAISNTSVHRITESSENERREFSSLPLLSEELSGTLDKANMLHIPSFFPEFPSRHTYKFTRQGEDYLRDGKKMREDAARSAQQGEDALRRLVRASKMRKQKEVKSLVERDVFGKERFRLWESTMERFMNSASQEDEPSPLKIADHSMIVNGEYAFQRRDVSRLPKRPGTGI